LTVKALKSLLNFEKSSVVIFEKESYDHVVIKKKFAVGFIISF